MMVDHNKNAGFIETNILTLTVTQKTMMVT